MNRTLQYSLWKIAKFAQESWPPLTLKHNYNQDLKF